MTVYLCRVPLFSISVKSTKVAPWQNQAHGEEVQGSVKLAAALRNAKILGKGDRLFVILISLRIYVSPKVVAVLLFYFTRLCSLTLHASTGLNTRSGNARITLFKFHTLRHFSVRYAYMLGHHDPMHYRLRCVHCGLSFNWSTMYVLTGIILECVKDF